MKLSREEKSWILVDCGNSAYSMAVTTALLPIMFGMFDNVKYSMDLGYFNSIASILVAVLSPVLGAAADYKDKKKRFFVFFTCLGVLATASLAFIPPSSGQWQLLILFFILSAIGFAGSNIFYDAFIVDVTSDERMDKISSLGFAFGYISSVIPFGISLVLIFLLGMDKSIGYQIGFIITALWWGLLTFPMIKDVKQIHYVEPEQHLIRNSFKRLAETFKQIRQYKTVFCFLGAYFFYIDGVDTIIKMVVPYATAVLWELSEKVFCQNHDYHRNIYLYNYLYCCIFFSFHVAYFHSWSHDRFCTGRDSGAKPILLCKDYPQGKIQ